MSTVTFLDISSLFLPQRLKVLPLIPQRGRIRHCSSRDSKAGPGVHLAANCGLSITVKDSCNLQSNEDKSIRRDRLNSEHIAG